MKQPTTTIKHYPQTTKQLITSTTTQNLHNPQPPSQPTKPITHQTRKIHNPTHNHHKSQTHGARAEERDERFGGFLLWHCWQLCQISTMVTLTSSSFLGSIRGRSVEHWFGRMDFWVRSKGKGSWIFGSLVEGREATWEKKARELGGIGWVWTRKEKEEEAMWLSEKR